jgi:hypothetical protein
VDELSKILFLANVLGILIVVALVVRYRLRRRARRFGYPGILVYFRAVPREDVEKRDAVDLTMQGAVLCLLGIGFFPLMLIGLFPLYYGGRKLILLGLDLGPTVNRERQRPSEVEGHGGTA